MSVVTLHSCPILEMVALPVCSPSMAFSLKNRKILSSSGLSLSGIKYIPKNLGSGEENNAILKQLCVIFLHYNDTFQITFTIP